MGVLFNYRRRLELLLLVAVLFLAFAAGDTWIAWVRRLPAAVATASRVCHRAAARAAGALRLLHRARRA
jgi:hypothetical protein